MYCSLVEDRIGSHYMPRGQYDHTIDGHGPSVVVYDKQQTMGVYNDSLNRMHVQKCTIYTIHFGEHVIEVWRYSMEVWRYDTANEAQNKYKRTYLSRGPRTVFSRPTIARGGPRWNIQEQYGCSHVIICRYTFRSYGVPE